MASRRGVLGGLAAGVLVIGAGAYAMLKPKPPETGFTLTDAELDATRAFMAAHPTIDTHAHPGRTFVRGAVNLAWKLKLYKLMGTFESRSVGDMKAGGVSAAVFNGVADFQLLDLVGDGLAAAREFAAGEAWESYRRQIANMRALSARGLIAQARTPAEVLAAHDGQVPGGVLAMEGADFLDGDLGRLAQAHADGVRMITLVHYHDNGSGDIITGAGGRGLTGFGQEAVATMNRQGIMIDLAHASEKTAFAAIAASSKPVAITHTHVNSPALHHARFISAELAQAVAASGGFIGAWPAGIGMRTLAEFVDRIVALVDLVGADHVALGSDMDANYKPVLETYRKMPLVVGALLRRGMAEADLAKVTGGNFLRMMAAVQSV